MEKILFILKERLYATSKSYGLINSDDHLCGFLTRCGYECKVVTVIDSNFIDKEVYDFKPDVVILEAIWVPTYKLKELLAINRYKHIKWVVRVHSDIGYLSVESQSIRYINEYKELHNHKLTISFNHKGLVDYLSDAMRHNFTYLPNVIDIKHPQPDCVREKGHIDIGCFGATRILKNQCFQAICAIKAADTLGKKLYFHITPHLDSATIDSVLENLKELFKENRHELVIHDWLLNDEFQELVKQMDIGLQLSYTESFNIVSADFINNGRIILGSDAIDWLPAIMKSSTVDYEEATKKIIFAYRLRNSEWLKQSLRDNLRHYNKQAEHEWLVFLQEQHKHHHGKDKDNPANKGKFTAWANAHGWTVQQAANMVLRNREKYSPTLIKRANFARNAAKWEDGGTFIGELPEYKSGGIHINPKNKGKFNALKKRTGKSTAELTHSKNPLTRKRAIFAQNAKKWKHEDGGMFEYGLGGFLQALSPLVNFIPGVGGVVSSAISGIGGSMEQNDQQGMLLAKKRHDDVIASARAGQAGAINPYQSTFKIGGTFKGKRFGGEPNAEVEGGEVLITPNGSQTNMGGPTHAQGGVDVNLPNNTMILSNKIKVSKGQTAADVARPYTSKINAAQDIVNGSATKLSKQSAKLNLNKYYAKVIDAFNTQESKKRKYQGGGYTIGDSWQDPNLMFKDQYKVDFGLPDFNTGNQDWYQPFKRAQFPGTGSGVNSATAGRNNSPFAVGTSNITMPDFSSAGIQGMGKTGLAGAPATGVTTKGEGFDWGNALGDIGAMAPMLYNLFAGKPKDINEERYNNPYEGQINSLMANRTYNIDPELAANENAFRTTAANMRNLGGSRGQVMSNLTGAQNTKQFGDMSAWAQKHNTENQYRGEQANMMYGIGRDKTAGRLAHDEAEAMDQASYRNMKGAAMTGLQQYLLTKRQMKNQSARDKLLINAIKGYSPYASKWVPGI